MTRPCVYCGDPTARVYSFDMDMAGVPACSYATPSGLGKPWPHYPPR